MMKSKLCFLLALCAAFVGGAFAQESSCRDLIIEYDSGSYTSVLNYVVRGRDVIKDGCEFNIAGLSVFKLPDSDSEEKRNLGLWLFSRSADLGYPAGSYNFYKYTYLKTNADLATILNGLSHLIAASNTDKWRSSSLKSVALGNEIINDCGGSSLAQNCRGRSVTKEQKASFETSTRKGLSTVSDDIPRLNREYQESKAVVDNIVLGLGLAMVLGPALIGNSAPAAAAKPVDPFQFVDPYPKAMTCLNGTCW